MKQVRLIDDESCSQCSRKVARAEHIILFVGTVGDYNSEIYVVPFQNRKTFFVREFAYEEDDSPTICCSDCADPSVHAAFTDLFLNLLDGLPLNEEISDMDEPTTPAFALQVLESAGAVEVPYIPPTLSLLEGAQPSY